MIHQLQKWLLKFKLVNNFNYFANRGSCEARSFKVQKTDVVIKMFTSETKVRVRYAETDQMGVVYHSNYFLYFEVARVESFRQLGIRYADMEKDGLVMPVVDVHARYIRPALYDDLLTIKTYVKEMPLHHKIEFHHEVFNEKEELLCVGKIILYVMEKGSMKRTVMPEALKKKVERYFQ